METFSFVAWMVVFSALAGIQLGAWPREDRPLGIAFWAFALVILGYVLHFVLF